VLHRVNGQCAVALRVGSAVGGVDAGASGQVLEQQGVPSPRTPAFLTAVLDRTGS
jgi:hypothetical protein